MPSPAFENLEKRVKVTQIPKPQSSAFDALEARSTAIKGTNQAPKPTQDSVKGGIVGEVLTGNTQRFGKTIGESIAAPANADLYDKALQSHVQIRNDVAKRIYEKKQRGEDVSRLQRVLQEHNDETPKLEDFTGDVINKTTGQILGEAGGTALEILPFGTFGKAAKVMKFGQLAPKLTKAPSVVEGAIKAFTKPKSLLSMNTAKTVGEGAAFGYGVDVTQGLQNKEGAGSFKPGIGTALGALAPVAVKGAGIQIEKAIANRAAKATAEVESLAARITQASDPRDIKLAKQALEQIDLKDIKSSEDLANALNERVKGISEGLDKVLDTEPYVKPLSELDYKVKTGTGEIGENYVLRALKQLSDLYEGSGDIAKKAQIDELILKGQKTGLTVKEINNIAKQHGRDLSAFKGNGDLKSTMQAKDYENTRKGLKATAREQFNNKIYNEADDALTALQNTRDLAEEMAIKVQKAKNKVKQMGLSERVGSLLEKALNIGSLGTSRGIMQAISKQIGTPFRETATTLELEKALEKSIRELDNIFSKGSTNDDILRKLNAFIKKAEKPVIKKPDNKLKAKPQSLKKDSPAMGKIVNLEKEAKKYKSADDFIKASGKTAYHTTNFANEIEKGGFKVSRELKEGSPFFGDDFVNGTYFTTNKKLVEEGGLLDIGGDILEVAIPKNLKLAKFNGKDLEDFVEFRLGRKKLPPSEEYYEETVRLTTEELKKMGYDGLEMAGSDGEVVIFDPSNIKTKSQLTKIYNKANKKSIFDLPNKQGGFATLPYREEGNLTTKILKDLEGKTTVSKQYILDATNRGELKQAERDITREVLATMPDGQVNVKEFAGKVKAELLPLKVMSSNSGGRYENIALSDELRGNVKNYKENIYESPIKTSAGDTHFGGDIMSGDSEYAGTVQNYFGHTRIEDMADNKTRRVIEVQSDLYQKGGLEREIDQPAVNLLKDGREAKIADKEIEPMLGSKIKDLERRQKEVAKLAQYNDPTAHFRMIREEVRKAAQDGKTKLQFPTGETAMKIEGLGETQNWKLLYDDIETPGGMRPSGGRKLKVEDLQVGQRISNAQQNAVYDSSSDWIITDVLGDGKFKAITKRDYDHLAGKYSWNELSKDTQNQLRGREFNETFDISGKVDTNNPIYRFYEKDVQKYLKKYDGKLVTDDKGVTWIEVPIKKEYDAPVEAFGKINPGIMLPIAGITGAAAGITKLANMSNKMTFKNPEVKIELKDPQIEQKFIDAIAKNETGGLKTDPYRFRKPSGMKSLGDDLGKYQVTEGELKTYAKRFLGYEPTPEQFIQAPGIQDKYMKGKFKYYSDLGYTPEQIADIHRNGYKRSGQPGSKVYQSPPYVNAFINNFK